MFEGWTYNEEGDLFRPCGKLCSKLPHHTGYLRVVVGGRKGKMFLQHRIVFFLHYGYWPKEVDHIDRVKENNAPINLRESNREDNNSNLNDNPNTLSGVLGVTYDKRPTTKKKWCARITISGKVKAKTFFTKEEAINQRLLWERERGIRHRSTSC